MKHPDLGQIPGVVPDGHALRNTFRFASCKCGDAMAKDLRPIYTAANEATALARFRSSMSSGGQRYPAITRMWRSAWTEFVPFVDYDVEVRRVICTTNAKASMPAIAGRFVLAGTARPSRLL